MGCFKLTYHREFLHLCKEASLEKSDHETALPQGKKYAGEKNCIDYYPFGLTFYSYSRENSVGNRYLYNQGTDKKTFKTERVIDLVLNVDQSKYRTYDYVTGRWWQVDPKADSLVSLTPYNYSFNNPLRYNDPEGDCPPGVDCNSGGMGYLKAALQSNVTSNLRSASNSASGIVSGNIGVQAAGIGGEIKIGNMLHIEATGRAFAGDINVSNNGVEPSVSAVTTDLSVKVVGLGPEFSQSDMKYDGDSFQLRDQSVNTGNQISIGATGGNLSGEVSFNLDAVKETISKGVDAVKEYVKNLLPTTIWEH